MHAVSFLIFISLLAPVRTVSPDATKNRKSSTTSRADRDKRTLDARRKFINHLRGKTSRATKNKNNLVRNRTPNRKSKPRKHSHSTVPNKNKDNSNKSNRASRSPVPRSNINREVLRYQMEILLSDPQMRRYYRRILKKKKKRQ